MEQKIQRVTEQSATALLVTLPVLPVLTDLPVALLEQTLERLATETNTATANWLMQQLQSVS